MRITTQLLKSKARPKGHLHSAVHLDLSSCNIDRIEKLSFCPKLRSLKLSDNNIESISNLEPCNELWKLDLNNNKVRSLDGLSRFIAMGTLVLCNNDLTWPELERIRHMHVLDLSLHGNRQLEKDPYYRIHVIDCLPNVWMLDGRIITSAERCNIQSFFKDSAITNHPVRHKLRKETFTPSCFKNINVNGIYGEKTTQLFRTFPINTVLNTETDKKRLLYLALNIESDLVTEGFTKGRASYFHKLLLSRDNESEKCNMLMLLLVASLDFSIPSPLMEATLEAAELTKFGEVSTMALFLLPKDIRCALLSLMLGSVKIERDSNVTGGLYDELYLCLYHTVSELTRQSQCPPKTPFNINKKTMALLRESRSLIAAEVVQLLCVVPLFFEYIISDSGVQKMVNIATGNNFEVIDKVNMILFAEKQGMILEQVYKGVAQLIVDGVEQATLKLLKNSQISSKFHQDILKMKHNPSAQSRSPSPSAKSNRSKASALNSAKSLSIDPARSSKKWDMIRLGDRVLLGPQNIAKIISIPDPKIVLVQMDVIPASSGAMIRQVQNPEAHYAYIDTAKLQWDSRDNYWRPIGTIGDRITIRPAEDSSDHSAGKSSSSSPKDDAEGCAEGVSVTPKTSAQSLTAAPTIPCTINLFDDNAKVSKKVPRCVSAQYKEKLQPTNSTQADNETDYSIIQQDVHAIKHSKDAEDRPVSAYTLANSEGSTFESKALSRHSSLDSVDDAELQQYAQRALNIDAANNTDWQQVGEASKQGNHSIKIPHASGHTPRHSSLSKESHVHPVTPSDLFTPTHSTVPVVTFQDANLNPRDLVGMTLNLDIAKDRRVKRSTSLGERRSQSASGKLYPGYYHMYRDEESKADMTVDNAVPVNKTSTQPSSSAKNKFSLRIQHGNAWLAEGRNVHLERMRSRPSSSREPGWKDGLHSRPSSAASRPRSAASAKSTGQSLNNYPTHSLNSHRNSNYISVTGSNVNPGPENFRKQRRPTSSAKPRSKDISIDDYNFISPKRVRFLSTYTEDVPTAGGFTPSAIMFQPSASKNRSRKSHKHKSGILCMECAYQQYRTHVINLELFNNDIDKMNEFERDYEDYSENDAQFDLEDDPDNDLESSEVISTYEPCNMFLLHEFNDVPEYEHEVKSDVDLNDTSQTQGQKVAVSGITIRVLHQNMLDPNKADMEDGSGE